MNLGGKPRFFWFALGVRKSEIELVFYSCAVRARMCRIIRFRFPNPGVWEIGKLTSGSNHISPNN
jgi:hypothetical protein